MFEAIDKAFADLADSIQGKYILSIRYEVNERLACIFHDDERMPDHITVLFLESLCGRTIFPGQLTLKRLFLDGEFTTTFEIKEAVGSACLLVDLGEGSVQFELFQAGLQVLADFDIDECVLVASVLGNVELLEVIFMQPPFDQVPVQKQQFLVRANLRLANCGLLPCSKLTLFLGALRVARIMHL